MNNDSDNRFQSLDTLMTALIVGGMAVACAIVIVSSGLQSVVA